MNTIIFDLDGTLADTSGDLIAAANACFIDIGVGPQLDDQTDASTAFKGARAMLQLGLTRLGRSHDSGIIEEQFPRLLDHYERNLDRTTRLYPGAMDAVQRLRDNGFRTGICTNKPEYLAVELLRRLGISDRFASMIGADTLTTRKPDPAPYIRSVTDAGGDVSKSLLVGDTITDRDTALAAGVPCILVTFGPDGNMVSDLQPSALMSDYCELDGLVADLLGP